MADPSLEEADRRERRRLDRTVDAFLRDERAGIRKERARSLLREIEYSLSDSRHADRRRLDIADIRREFELDGDLTQSVPRFDLFRQAIERLKYADRLEDQDAAVPVPPVVRAAPEDVTVPPKSPRRRGSGTSSRSNSDKGL